jgi:hypothetical protein
MAASLPLAQRNPSPELVTPTNTPPTMSMTHTHHAHPHHNPILGLQPSNADHRQHLLAIFSSGTHAFCQEDRGGSEPVERRKSFAEGKLALRLHLDDQSDNYLAHPNPPGSRRTSFLSGLTLSRPFVFASQPSSGTSTPTSTSYPKDNYLPTSSNSTVQSLLSQDTVGSPSSDGASRTQQPARSQTMPLPLGKPLTQTDNQAGAKSRVAGFSGSNGNGAGAVSRFVQADDRRHFDPSREPRLLGLL